MEKHYSVKYYYTVPHGVEKDHVDCKDLAEARYAKQHFLDKGMEAKIDVWDSDGNWIEEVR